MSNQGTLEATAGTLNLGGNLFTAATSLGTVEATGGAVNVMGTLSEKCSAELRPTEIVEPGGRGAPERHAHRERRSGAESSISGYLNMV